MTDTQKELFDAYPGPVGHRAPTNQTPVSHGVLPALITKKALCVHYGLVSARGRVNYRRLYLRVLTPEVLQALDMKPETVRNPGMKEFDAVRSARLRQILHI